MPFTLSHPAIILRLSDSRYKLSLTGLIAGSMVPDFEYYFQMKLDENLGHHVHGIPLFDIPVALMLCFLFHNLIRNPLIYYLPQWYRSRLVSIVEFNWNEYAWKNKLNIILSVFIGVLSHLAWDGFTHHDGFFVEQLTFLSAPVTLGGKTIHVYDLLQVISSLWGLWYLQYYIASMPVYKLTATTYSILPYWATLSFATLVIFLLRFLIFDKAVTSMDFVFAFIGSMIYATIILSAALSKLKIFKRFNQS
jgi:hypothetical protein